MTSVTLSRALLLFAAMAVAGCDVIGKTLPWKRYSIASQSMEPTLRQGSVITASPVALANVKRGDILIVRKGDVDYVTRLAALPGDRIALVDGIVVLNGKRIEQRPIGRWKAAEPGPHRDATVMSERFPGERGTHRVLDSGLSPGDNFEEMAMPEERYFVLGDNRDNSADSRYGNDFGIGVVKAEDILRRVTPPED